MNQIFNKIIDENFPQLRKHSYTCKQHTNTQHDQERNTLQNITVSKRKKILKAAREKTQVKYKGKLIRIISDFSTKMLKV